MYRIGLSACVTGYPSSSFRPIPDRARVKRSAAVDLPTAGGPTMKQLSPADRLSGGWTAEDQGGESIRKSPEVHRG